MVKEYPNPLAGKRVVITRAAAQSEALARELSARGAIPVVLPLVSFADPQDFAALDRAIAEIERFDWIILTSAQAVRALAQRSRNLGRPLTQPGSRLRVACIGPVTAEAAGNAGLRVEHVAETHNGVALADELGRRLRGSRVFLPRSDRANPDLSEALTRHGAEVTEVIAYRTLRPTHIDREKLRDFANGGADAMLFFSPSAVQHFGEVFGVEQFRALQDKLAITAVGPVTAKALHEAGAFRIVLARDTTTAAVIEALEKHFSASMKQVFTGAKRA